MSINYSVDLRLKAVFNEEKVGLILQKGKDIGFIYYDHICGERYSTSPVLNVNDATRKMLDYSEEIVSDGGPNIWTKFEDTYFTLWIREYEKGFIDVFIAGTSYPWKKDFWNGAVDHGFDFARYIRLLLKLCEDFTIVEVRTSAD